MRKIIRYFLVFILLIALVLVRAYENEMFYDPFIVFFQNDYLYTSVPEFEYGRLIWDLFLRYSLNSIISLGIIYLVFEKLGYVILSAKLYVLGFVLLISAYTFLLSTGFEKGYLLPFYVRRFLIHPLFLLLLMAALFYEKIAGIKPTLR
ncbi:exosortase F system-associated protein [Flavicella sp.]|uniref:exosortase F system-associated membrane protein n=1 Tax=Flavicella sp. TaxID=2957742 RepID=UPI002611CCBC|nr:exosortase F system-associated protein [Flavicella sp.]MDG1806162.1 exosortase F system-associated protein [Flavicella sp.]